MAALVHLEEVLDWLKDVSCPPYTFEAFLRGDEVFIQAHYMEPDRDDPGGFGLPVKQTTRKWFLSRFATHSEVIQTALKCALTSAEHRIRESFKYRGRRVYSPHYNVDALWKIADHSDEVRQ